MADDSTAKKGEAQLRSYNLLGAFVAMASFPLFAAVASLAGAIFPAMVFADQHTAHPDLRIVWSPLLNAVLAGSFLGVLFGAFCIAEFSVFHAGVRLLDCTDRALNAVETPLFWVSLASGIVIGILTVTRFHGALIWNWRVF